MKCPKGHSDNPDLILFFDQNRDQLISLRRLYLGYTYWKTGEKDKARKLFQKSLNLYQAQLEQGSELSTIPYEIATIYAIQGKKEEAYKWLQKAIDAGWRFVRQGLTDPLLENLHEDEQFKQMMAQVKEMVEEMRKRIEEKD